MPSATNYYAFCADYSDMATCLFAIQTSLYNGVFDQDPELLQMLRVFEQDVLRKLYVRTINILQVLDDIPGIANDYLPGDFDQTEFYNKDFDVGYLLGDFSDDYSDIDYDTGYLDITNTGFSSLFQTILNIFKEFARHLDEISEADKSALDAALAAVLDAFSELQTYLISVGLNPCTATTASYYNNSTDIYVQAAGADGSDGVADGIHLRWSFAGELGTYHLAKGTSDNINPGSAAFNQANDYVYLSRTPYINNVRFNIDFELNAPVINYALKQWSYVVNQTIGDLQLSNRIILTFTDAILYNQLATTINPLTDYFNFLNSYSGIIQLQVLNKSLFLVGLALGNPGSAGAASFKAEAVCIADTESQQAETVYARQTFTADPGESPSVTFFAENIQQVNLKKNATGIWQGFSFETYHDFLQTRVASDWTAISNGFALSVDDAVVYDRLENSSYPVDDLWPQYIDGTKVKVANYRDKWASSYTDNPSMSSVVTEYLALSKTDPRASVVFAEDGGSAESPGITVSYLDMLNLVASDFHIARMLGLGCIDVTSGGTADDRFIYRMVYANSASADDPTLLNRSYLSLPTALSTSLLPDKPAIRPVTYGLPAASAGSFNAFDSQGYSSYDNTRAINIGRELFNDEQEGYDFFADLTLTDNTNIFEQARPIYYGIDYRPAGQSGYVKPAITDDPDPVIQYYAYDPDFPETGVRETILVPDDPSSLFLHFEKLTGIHYYAIYGVNWFSRTSVLSDEVSTDATAFPLKNHLQPPTDVAVQYIQEEDTLLFTTQQEQDWLTGRTSTFPGQDVSFTRIVFNWIDIVDISALIDTSPAQLATVVRPDKVNAYFNPELPLQVLGAIKKITAVSGSTTQFDIYTGTYKQIDGTTVSPQISPADYFRFNNSLLTTIDGQYQVVSVRSGVITIEQNVQTTATEDSTTPGNYGAQQVYSSPSVNSRFSMVENLSNAANWDTMAEGVSLYSFADSIHPVTEPFVDSEGNSTLNWIGGINKGTVITPLFTPADLPTDLPGYYRLDFSDYTLAPNPQVNLPFDPADPDKNAPTALHGAHVEWYKGWVRLDRASGVADKKLVEVLRIDSSDSGLLVLYIYDPAFQTDPIVVSASTSQTFTINFHPGYRCYFFPEPAPNAFNGTNILPKSGQDSLKTLIGLQTADSRLGGSGFTSPVSAPAILLSRRIQTPVAFEAPVASSFKVRPDATAKAAFTFDVKIAPAADGSTRSPFGFKFCRTTEEDVLEALYEAATVTAILTDLAALTTDDNYNQRYFELVNLIFDPANPGSFRVFDAIPNPYGFPVPDKSSLDPSGYSTAIRGTILPLTAQTPTFIFIKSGLQTDNKQPVIRDINGNLLDPSDPSFDPFPMVRQYTKTGEANTTYIRFTDYSLNASSRRLYFYAAAEVTNQLIAGPLSPFAGPVTILNTIPPEEPIVQTFSIVPSPVAGPSPIAVTFQLSPLAPYDTISSIRLYRTNDLGKTGTLSSMGTYVDNPVGPESLAGFTVTDTFADMTVMPFGELVYYRIIGVRVIINEFNLPEEVISLPSDIAVITLIDTVNPTAPQLTYTAGNATLSWTPTVNKGTYYLYQQNSKGNWTLLATDKPADPNASMEFQLVPPPPSTDDSGNPVYNRFKVTVENSSGLLNLVDNILTF